MNKKGRPYNEQGEPRVNRCITFTEKDKEILLRYGSGSLSAGVSRAAKLIAKYDLYNREDL